LKIFRGTTPDPLLTGKGGRVGEERGGEGTEKEGQDGIRGFSPPPRENHVYASASL